jgi:hypothetical protein
MSRALPADPDGQNDDRAEWAHKALKRFAKETGLVWEEIEDGTALADLLAGLMHWCDCYAVEFQDMLDRAKTYYDETKE